MMSSKSIVHHQILFRFYLVAALLVLVYVVIVDLKEGNEMAIVDDMIQCVEMEVKDRG